MDSGPGRTAALAAWFQGLYAKGSLPVLVGGAAVELMTNGAYLTGDLDFVGDVPQDVASALLVHGFKRSGRHWVHEQGEIFIELPGSGLEKDEQQVLLRRGDVVVRVISPEDLVVDRLAAWQFWDSHEDAINAFLIWKDNKLNAKRLRALAEAREVNESLERLDEFRRRFRGREPSAEQLELWAERR